MSHQTFALQLFQYLSFRAKVENAELSKEVSTDWCLLQINNWLRSESPEFALDVLGVICFLEPDEMTDDESNPQAFQLWENLERCTECNDKIFPDSDKHCKFCGPDDPLCEECGEYCNQCDSYTCNECMSGEHTYVDYCWVEGCKFEGCFDCLDPHERGHIASKMSYFTLALNCSAQAIVVALARHLYYQMLEVRELHALASAQ